MALGLPLRHGCDGTSDPVWGGSGPHSCSAMANQIFGSFANFSTESCTYGNPANYTVPAYGVESNNYSYGPISVSSTTNNCVGDGTNGASRTSTCYSDSVVSPLSTYSYPNTAVRFLYADGNTAAAGSLAAAVNLGMVYANAVTSNKMIKLVVHTGTNTVVPHELPGHPDGGAAIYHV